MSCWSGPLQRLFLIGYRATGKSTVARVLAARTAWVAWDIDVLLEEQAGCSIRQIFATEGEAGFRRREAAMLAELCNRERCIVATGGGVVLARENRQRLREHGPVVWLTASPEVLWQRLQADPFSVERRPQLTTGGRAEIEELLRQREPFYRDCADIQVDTTYLGPEEVAEIIQARWKLS